MVFVIILDKWNRKRKICWDDYIKFAPTWTLGDVDDVGMCYLGKGKVFYF